MWVAVEKWFFMVEWRRVLHFKYFSSTAVLVKWLYYRKKKKETFSSGNEKQIWPITCLEKKNCQIFYYFYFLTRKSSKTFLKLLASYFRRESCLLNFVSLSLFKMISLLVLFNFWNWNFISDGEKDYKF